MKWIAFVLIAALLGSFFHSIMDWGFYYEVGGEQDLVFDMKWNIGLIVSSVVGLLMAGASWGAAIFVGRQFGE
jgi:hypothetical protein